MIDKQLIAQLIADLEHDDRRDQAKHKLIDLWSVAVITEAVGTGTAFLEGIQSLSKSNAWIPLFVLNRLALKNDVNTIKVVLQIIQQRWPMNFPTVDNRSCAESIAMLLHRFEIPEVLEPLAQTLYAFHYVNPTYEGGYEDRWDEGIWKTVRLPFLKLPEQAVVPLARLAAQGNAAAARMLAEIVSLVPSDSSQLKTLTEVHEILIRVAPDWEGSPSFYIERALERTHNMLESISSDLDQNTP